MTRISCRAAAITVAIAVPAAGYTVPEVRYAALDQPLIHATLRTSAGGAPLTYKRDVLVGLDPITFETIDSINVPFYFDTGAGASLLSAGMAEALGIAPTTHDPDGDGPLPPVQVVATDVGIGGNESFHVAPSLWIDLAPVNEFVDVENLSSYSQTYGPTQLHLQIPDEPDPNNDLPDEFDGLLASGFDVLGMPYFENRTVVMDLRPSNALVADTNQEFDGAQFSMRTYVYTPGESYRPQSIDSDPGIVPADATVRLSYGDFGAFTTVAPNGAAGPTVSHNPFVGTAPVSDSAGPSSESPKAAVRFGDEEARASLLFDTGGSVSLLSTALVESLGITVLRDGDNHPIGFHRDGVTLDTFSVSVEGVGGVVELHGLYLDGLVIPTEEGDPNNLDDPRHLHFGAAPFFVIDLAVTDPNGGEVILDGVLGMNYLAPSAEIAYLDLGPYQLPTPIGQLQSGFDWLTFDEATGTLGVSFIPEPAGFVAMAAFATLLAAQRRRRTR